MPSLEQWRSYYDSWAGGNPLLASTGHEEGPAAFAALGMRIADWLELDGTQHALDVGCASGTLTSQWAPRAASVTAVDYSKALLDDGARRHPNLDFVHAEAAKLPFDDATFDTVSCFGVLLSLPDHDYVERTIDEFLRVAKPNARILLGSLPDEQRREAFFAQLESAAPWYRRAVPRPVWDAARKVLRPQARPGKTKILWFDIDQLALDLQLRGLAVEVAEDHAFAGYEVYRRSLILRRAPVEVAT
ncbi:MAG: methyltransferase domain-containing protein [Planctomycetota bacterium]